jgi:hypothetical protein
MEARVHPYRHVVGGQRVLDEVVGTPSPRIVTQGKEEETGPSHEVRQPLGPARHQKDSPGRQGQADPDPRREPGICADREHDRARQAARDIPRVGAQSRKRVHRPGERLPHPHEGNRREDEHQDGRDEERELDERLVALIALLKPVMNGAASVVDHDPPGSRDQEKQEKRPDRQAPCPRPGCAEDATQSQPEEAGEEQQIREVGDRPDFRRDHPDEGQLEGQDEERNEEDVPHAGPRHRGVAYHVVHVSFSQVPGLVTATWPSYGCCRALDRLKPMAAVPRAPPPAHFPNLPAQLRDRLTSVAFTAGAQANGPGELSFPRPAPSEIAFRSLDLLRYRYLTVKLPPAPWRARPRSPASKIVI